MEDKVVDLDAIIAKREGAEAPVAETPTEETPAAETPVETPEAETPATETPAETPAAETPAVEAPAAEAPAAPVDEDVDLDEIHVDGKSVNSLLDERDVMAERLAKIDGDEFLKRFLDHYEATKDPSAFLESQAVNWDKKDDLSVIRAGFEKENSDLPESTRELLFEEELKNKYKIDPNAPQEDIDKDAKDYKIGQALLKRDADKARAKFKDEQKKFEVPAKPTETAATPVDTKVLKESYKKQLSEELADFKTSKLLSVEVQGEAGAKFGYEVENPDEVIEMMTSDKAFWGQFLNKEGKVDRVKQAKVYAYAKDPAAFEKQLVEFGKTLATEQKLKEKRNSDDLLNKGKPAVETASDFKTGFLKALRQQTRKGQ